MLVAGALGEGAGDGGEGMHRAGAAAGLLAHQHDLAGGLEHAGHQVAAGEADRGDLWELLDGYNMEHFWTFTLPFIS